MAPAHDAARASARGHVRGRSDLPGSPLALAALSTVTSALFPPWTNTALLLAVVAAALSGLGTIVGLFVYVRSPHGTGRHVAVEQPVMFDHRHHAGDDEIDCLYCHADADRSPSAGIPSTETCMGCHSQVWPESSLLEPVRRSYFSGQALAWTRVHDLPDFVHFDHAAHHRAGVGCSHCHGDVEGMSRVVQVAPLTMIWCLDCHRNPTAQVSAVRIEPPLLGDGGVTRLTTCTACHR